MLNVIVSAIQAGNLSRLIARILRALGWDATREMYMNFLYMVGVMTVLFVLVKTIIFIFTIVIHKIGQ